MKIDAIFKVRRVGAGAPSLLEVRATTSHMMVMYAALARRSQSHHTTLAGGVPYKRT